jgi:hypothetical protein
MVTIDMGSGSLRRLARHQPHVGVAQRRGAGRADHRRARAARRPAAWARCRPRQNGAAGDDGQRFAALQVLQAESAAAATGSATIDDADPATRLLPPGFSTTRATDVVAVCGAAVNLDRGQLRDRLDALGRGDFALPAVNLRPGRRRRVFGAGRAADRRSGRRWPGGGGPAGLSVGGRRRRRRRRARRVPRTGRGNRVAGLHDLHVRRLGARRPALRAARNADHAPSTRASSSAAPSVDRCESPVSTTVRARRTS